MLFCCLFPKCLHTCVLPLRLLIAHGLVKEMCVYRYDDKESLSFQIFLANISFVVYIHVSSHKESLNRYLLQLCSQCQCNLSAEKLFPIF